MSVQVVIPGIASGSATVAAVRDRVLSIERLPPVAGAVSRAWMAM